MTRPVTARYVDPLDAVWLGAAARLGLRVQRGAHAYASTDGRGTLTIAPPEALDADDCLAQIIFHELCHALVQGEDSFGRADWGLDNDERGEAYRDDAAREHACLRAQAALLTRHGLRRLLAPTTDFRPFYDALPADPLAGPREDRSIALARAALGRALRPPFSGVLEGALRATAVIAREAAAATEAPGEGPRALYHAAPPSPLHPTGLPMAEPGAAADAAARRCGDCAWCHPGAGGRGARCRRAGAARIDRGWAACALFEAGLDCQGCGACCRHAFDLVPLGRRELAARRHPELVEADGARLKLRRAGPRCAALAGPPEGPYACVIYDDRPRTCRDFTLGSAACLEARRRVGLSL